ncbi:MULTISPECIES: hypothetical protein [Anoxybacillus]|jgi:vacuolar-type H+-ATPase subunit I/STV1|uniref:hypothetical protein n=1 Tax=Anoxybacillaceae TaxID=3120669 RepID=UPI0005CD0E99|nr:MULTISPECIES: hypothetical protein [Anoxybacillus]MBS2771996.1 hypothetical protein [Anoxybacillus rupiensis]
MEKHCSMRLLNGSMYKMPEMEQMKRGIAHLQGEVKRFKEDASAQKEDVAMLKKREFQFNIIHREVFHFLTRGRWGGSSEEQARQVERLSAHTMEQEADIVEWRSMR